MMLGMQLQDTQMISSNESQSKTPSPQATFKPLTISDLMMLAEMRRTGQTEQSK